MTRYAIALGSNVGRRLEHLLAAVESLSSPGRIDRVSGLYETAPVGGPAQDPYLNAVVTVDTDLFPEALLDRLQEIEDGRGRKRATRWGPRTLDLDIVASDGPVVNDSELMVPHPRASERRFVLEPLADVWPEALVAEGLTAFEALAQVGDQAVELLSRRWAGPRPQQPGRYVVGVQLLWFLAIAVAMSLDGSFPGADSSGWRIVGGLLAVVGGLLAFLSARELGSAMSLVPEPRPDVKLVETGPFAHARHPIYGGVTLFVLGTAVVAASLSGVLLSVGLGVLFWVKSEYEERQLRIAYPGYAAYRERVTRRLIPFLF